MEYEVIYRIDIDAKSHLAAALEAEEYINNPNYRPYLEVKNTKTGTIKKIDLHERKSKGG